MDELGAGTIGAAECMHGLEPANCSACLLKGSPRVFVSGGGQSYHLIEDCPALVRGQRSVDARSGEVAEVKHVSMFEAKRGAYQPCERCTRSSKPIELQPESYVAQPPANVWVCAEEWSRRSRRANGRFHDRRSCPLLVQRLAELAGTLQRLDRATAMRVLTQCSSCEI